MSALSVPAISRFDGLLLCCALAACVASESPRPSRPAAGGTASSAKAEAASHPDGIRRTLVAHRDVAALPGFESRLYLVEYPPGAEDTGEIPARQCVGYVLEGRAASVFADGSTRLSEAGEAFIDPPQRAQRTKNPDPSHALRFVLAGTFRQGDPLLAPAANAPVFGAVPARASRAPSEPAQPGTGVKRQLLAQRDLGDPPGFESRIYLMDFPPNAASKLHLHTSQGIGYVIEGSFESAFGDDPPSLKRAGDGFVDVPDRPHHFRNPDPEHHLRFVFAGTFRHDEPLFKALEE
jgi:hypothetical protein